MWVLVAFYTLERGSVTDAPITGFKYKLHSDDNLKTLFVHPVGNG